MTGFSALGLAAPIIDALANQAYESPTPIQSLAIPPIMAGHDLLGVAATGTGKTAAFALPILDRLAAIGGAPPRRACRALVLAPTRELAAQIAESFRVYGRGLRLKVAVVVGGVAAGPQITALTAGVDVLVATPGRLLDHVSRGVVKLDQVVFFVLDEVDHMLDLGFIPGIRKLVKHLPAKRQNLFFSATMPPPIQVLADELLRNPKRVSATPQATPAERIDQQVAFVESTGKTQMLARILGARASDRVLVFTRTKHGADKVVRNLARDNIEAAAIHGNKSQGQRTRALADFRAGKAPVLVATDIAARGIDVDDIALVVNFDLPNVPETYVHRIGRTARAGAAGAAVSLCSPDERPFLRAIEVLVRRSIPKWSGETYRDPRPTRVEPAAARPAGKPQPAPAHSAVQPPETAPTNGSALAGLSFLKTRETQPHAPGRHPGASPRPTPAEAPSDG